MAEDNRNDQSNREPKADPTKPTIMTKHELRPPIQVFGSDLNARALAVAREGRYPASIEDLRPMLLKYGSLSWIGRTILVKWTVRPAEGHRILEFIWEEHGVPSVPEPMRQGLGSALIEGAIPNATVRREFRADDWCARFKLQYESSDMRSLVGTDCC